MGTILGAKFRFGQIVGLIIVASALIFMLYTILDNAIPKQDIVTTDELRQINSERYRYIDSINASSSRQFLDSIRFYTSRQYHLDSSLYFFYNFKTIEYNEKINHINNATHSELLGEWTARFGR